MTDVEGDTLTQSSLSTDLDVSSRLRTEKVDVRTRFSGGYLNDFLENGVGDEGRIVSMYMNMSNLNKDISARIGRQTRSTGGVLGRFDGGHFSYQWTPQAKVNLVAGFPVDSSSDSPQSDRYFYGASVDLGTYASAWDFILFAIEQVVDGIDDRQAVGGEVRYFHPERSLLSLVDYDTSYEELNTFLLIGNWTLPNQITINSTVDYRNSPLITTRNALQGQTAASVNNLLLTKTEDEIRQLAIDRTAESRTFTFGLSKPVHPKLQVSGDFTVTSITSTPASDGVEATPETGNDYLYNLQFIGSNLIKEGDITILGLRYSDTSSSKTTSFTVNSRYPVIREWRINPRLRLDYRDNVRDSSSQWTFAPSIRSEYRWKRKYRFELEAGGERSNIQLTDTTDKTTSYFFSMGYRADF